MNKINYKKRTWQIITLSANTEIELDQHVANMLHYFKQYPEVDLADSAYVLNLNQHDKRYRFLLVADTVENLIQSIEKQDVRKFFYGAVNPFKKTNVIFMFPGQGTDYKLMGKQLYEKEPVFKKYLDECNKIIKELTQHDIIDLYYYSSIEIKSLSWEQRSIVTLNAILALEYSLAKLIIALGVKPDAFIGYSMGEVASAILSGVFTLSDGIEFMTEVARQSKDLDNGGLLAVKITVDKVRKYLIPGVEIASINSQELLLFGGEKVAINLIAEELENSEYFIKKLNIPCPYHTSYINEIKNRLVGFFNHITLNKENFPIFSSCLGRRAKENELSTKKYWIDFFAESMNLATAFEDCVSQYPEKFFIEVGPSASMTAIAKKITGAPNSQIPILIANEEDNEQFNLMVMLGKAWLNGCLINWPVFYEGQSKNIHKLPRSPFIDNKLIEINQRFGHSKVNITLPKDEKERIIYEVFKRVLAYEKISTEANFFSLGGDSLLAMQCIAMLNEKGFGITLNYFINNPTVAALAQYSKIKKADSEDTDRTGEIPLIPLQVRFFRKPKHWSEQKLIPTLILTPNNLNISRLKLACEALVKYHDALRLRYVHQNGVWHQFLIDYEEITFKYILLSEEKNTSLALEVAIAHEQSQFDLQDGPLVKFMLAKSKKELVLVISCHHLCVDGVSVSILIKDLIRFYNQLEYSSTITFPQKTTSFKKWANYLRSFSNVLTEDDTLFWESQACQLDPSIPLDYRKAQINLASSVRELTFNLDEYDTEMCLRKAPFNLNGVGVFEILLLACSRAFYKWTNIKEFYIDLRSHGRHINSEEIDLSKTVGWLTIVFPYLVKVNTTLNDVTALLYDIQKNFRNIPYNGLSYGVMRYLTDNEKIRKRMDLLKQAEIAFNYHGQLDYIQEEIRPFSMIRYPIANSPNSLATRSHLINIDAMIFNKKLIVTLSYSKDFHKKETIKNYGLFILDEIKSTLKKINV